jgi:rRNA-processing protein FCF1
MSKRSIGSDGDIRLLKSSGVFKSIIVDTASMRYLLDTSSLISIVEDRWYDRLEADERVGELATLPCVLDELEKLMTKGGTRARTARTARAFARQTLKTAPEPAGTSHVDDALLNVAGAYGWGIVSQDHALIKRAKQQGIPTLTLTRSGTIGD